MKRWLAILILWGSLGCHSTYFHDRAEDFVDIWRLGITYGPGALVNARATKFVQVGIGGMEVYKYGMRGRAMGHWQEFRGEGGVSLAYFMDYQKSFISGNERLAEEIREVQRPRSQIEEPLADLDPFYGDRNFTEIGVTLHAFAFGIEFAIDFYSLLDFLGGWLLLDPQQDDLYTLRKKELQQKGQQEAAR